MRFTQWAREGLAHGPDKCVRWIKGDMLDEAGEPKAEYLIWDGLHMNGRGYALWTRIILRELGEHLN